MSSVIVYLPFVCWLNFSPVSRTVALATHGVAPLVLALDRDTGRGAAKSRSATTLADRAASGRQVEGQVAAVLAPAVHVVVLAAETD